MYRDGGLGECAFDPFFLFLYLLFIESRPCLPLFPYVQGCKIPQAAFRNASDLFDLGITPDPSHVRPALILIRGVK